MPDSAMSTESLADELVAANHILFHEGVVDAYGHVSARTDERHFLLARYVAPGRVTRDDILTFDLDGNIVDRPGTKTHSEMWIHAAIYAARPDVRGVVHSHSHAIIPFGVTKVPLRPIFHVASFLGDGPGVAHFDTRPVAGDTDLLIKNMDLGRALAQALGPAPVALMRGHGSVAVGASLREAVYRAVYTEVNAKVQTEAMRFGAPIDYLSAGECALMAKNRLRDPEYSKPWQFWLEEIGQARG